MRDLNIVYVASDSFAKLAGISMLSLFENNKSADSINVYILENNFSETNRIKLRQIGKDYCRSVSLINIEKRLSEIVDTGVSGYTSAFSDEFIAYAKFLIGDLLPPNIERILYLDCDTLVNADISPLFSMNMNEKPLAMVLDCLRNEYKQFIGKRLSDKYYNSGVMLLDLPLWRTHRCKEKIMHHIQHVRASYPLVDQDLINISLHDDVLSIGLENNFMSQCFLYGYENTLKVYGLHKNCWHHKDDFEKARSKATIYHFCGQTFIRPWYANSAHPLKKQYDRFFYISPWKNEKQNTFKLSLPYRIQYHLYRYYAEWFSAFVGKIMQRMFIKITYGQ